MMSNEHHRETRSRSDGRQLEEAAQNLIHRLNGEFDGAIKSYVWFTMAFSMLALAELLAFVLAFSYLTQSSLLAASLAVIFLSFFSYLILRLFMLARKEEAYQRILTDLEQNCKELIHYQDAVPEHHLFLANCFTKAGSSLQDREYLYYKPPAWLDVLGPLAEKLSCWWHWEDLHQMQQLCLSRAIEEYIKLVKCEPTNLEVHAALANAYVLLSALYAPPRQDEIRDSERWIHPARLSEEMQQRYRETAQRAIEEFKILNHYAPDDPWIHAQLAYSYRDLQMPEEEIAEYEKILRLRPDDTETQLKLGQLYFQQGKNALGLQIYESLKRTHGQRAEQLLQCYGVAPVV